MNIRIIFLILSISVVLFPADIFLYAQNNKNKIEEIRGLLENKNKIDSSFLMMSEMLKDTLKLNKNEKGELYYLFTLYYSYKNKEDVEFIFNKKAELIFRELKNEKRICDLLFAKFNLFDSQKNLDTLIKPKVYLDEFYKLSIKNNFKKNIIKAYKGFAELEIEKGKFQEPLIFYNKAIKLCVELNDSSLYADILNNKGNLYIKKIERKLEGIMKKH